MFSFGSSEIKIAYSYLAVVIRLQPSVLNSEHNVDFFFFFGDAKVLDNECTFDTQQNEAAKHLECAR